MTTDQAEIQDIVTTDQVKNYTMGSLKESRVLNRGDRDEEGHI